MSVLEIGCGVFEVKATSATTTSVATTSTGDRRLVSEFKKSRASTSRRSVDFQRLGDPEAAEQETQINLPFITADAQQPRTSIRRAKLTDFTAEPPHGRAVRQGA